MAYCDDCTRLYIKWQQVSEASKDPNLTANVRIAKMQYADYLTQERAYHTFFVHGVNKIKSHGYYIRSI
jgi:hypothetical protein